MLNKINAEEFLSAVTTVMHRLHPKKNCLYITGPSDVGKTMIIQLIADVISHGYVTKGNVVFALSQLVHKSFALWSEFYMSDSSSTMKNQKIANAFNIDQVSMSILFEGSNL